jgi:hypothetical protein
MSAVKKDGAALQYASEALRSDRSVVLAAVKSYGWALASASVELRADRDVVLAAIDRDPKVLKFASKELQKNLKKLKFNRESEMDQSNDVN